MRHYVFLILTLLTLSACQKDDNNENPPQTSKTDLLINKKWVRTEITLKAADGTETNGIDVFQPYDYDDYLLFQADGTFIARTGEMKDPNDPDGQNDDGIWNFENGETDLRMKSKYVPGKQYYPTRILELTTSKLKLELLYPDDMVGTFTFNPTP